MNSGKLPVLISTDTFIVHAVVIILDNRIIYQKGKLDIHFMAHRYINSVARLIQE